MKTGSLLSVRDLRVRFETHGGTVHAVRGIDLDLEPGETLGVVGESGSGKSVTSLAVMGLVPSPPGVVEAERIQFDGQELLGMRRRQLRRLRGASLSMIFQDPMTSLNPLLTVGRQLTEVLETHRVARGRAASKRCAEALGEVGIPNPEARLESYPHELSGGMRQRVMIAMGLLCRPKLIFADEPTTALDVTIQAQILDLMGELQRKHGMAIVLITHDLGVVAGMCDRVQVMYAGRTVERAPGEDLFARPRHPYTRGLLRSVPTLAGSPDETLFSIPGQPPDPAGLPPGCAFAERCKFVSETCRASDPALESVESGPGGERAAACLRVEEVEQLATEQEASR